MARKFLFSDVGNYSIVVNKKLSMLHFCCVGLLKLVTEG